MLHREVKIEEEERMRTTMRSENLRSRRKGKVRVQMLRISSERYLTRGRVCPSCQDAGKRPARSTVFRWREASSTHQRQIEEEGLDQPR